MSKFTPSLVALLTTHNRSSLLADRSLASVAKQTRLPDLVIIADDSSSDNYRHNQNTVAAFQQRTAVAVQTIHLGAERQFRPDKHDFGGHTRNRNSAVLTVLAQTPGSGFDPQRTWLAILDDDDEWLPTHLAQLEETITQSGNRVDFLPAAYYWCDANDKKARYLPDLNERDFGRDFLVGNPGVNGSTLVVRLSVLLRAGMFEESLTASEDRDLCVRLSLLKDLICQQPPAPSVNYYAEDRDRVSQPRTPIRIEGVARFADKYRGWMSDAEYSAFTKRSKKLFGWRGQSPKPAKPISNAQTHTPPPTGKSEIALICGVIVQPTQDDNQLFNDFIKLAKDPRLTSLDVVVVPESTKQFQSLQKQITRCRNAGLRIYCVSNSHANSVIRKLGISLPKKNQSRPIAINRTILQYAMAAVGNTYQTPVGWVLDGDSRLLGLRIRNGKVEQFLPNYIGEILRLRAQGYDFALGEINGAPPLPRALNIRTQLVDLLHFMARLHRPNAQRHFPSLTLINVPHSPIAPDYYHDCGEHPHLEQPIGLLPLPKTCSPTRFIRELPDLLTRLLAGDAVTRPLLSEVANTNSTRGGNTVFFNWAALNALPNGFIHGAFGNARRQDEVWRIIGERTQGWQMGISQPGKLAVTQMRGTDEPCAPDMQRLVADVVGHSISHALKKCGGTRGERFHDINQWRDFLLDNEEELFSLVQSAAQNRLTMIRQSFFRIVGLAESMQSLLPSTSDHAARRNAIRMLGEFQKRFADEKVVALGKEVHAKLKRKSLRSALLNFAKLSQQPHADSSWVEWLHAERVHNAHCLVKKITAKKTSSPKLTLLGNGGEGTVFKNEHQVFKVLHRWESRPNAPFQELLAHLKGNWNPSQDTVYPLLDFRNDGGDLMLTMPFEKTAPYPQKNGGGNLGLGWVKLLAGMKKRGMVFWNIAPKNLRVTPAGAIRFVDYGCDVYPFAERDFDLAIRKAWLCWKFAARKNLTTLLTASLTDDSLPELQGYLGLKSAVEKFAVRARTQDTAVAALLNTYQTSVRVLDYGCGRGKDSILLSEIEYEVEAYDPNLTAKTRRELKAKGVRVLTQTQLDANTTDPFDAILLRHVLCEVHALTDLRECLNNVHALCKPNGAVWVTACDMNRPVKQKTYSVNFLPRSVEADANANKRKHKHTFSYRKQIRMTGSIREHVHYPTEMLLEEFERAGFSVSAERKFREIDLQTMQPCGGVLQWKLTPK